MDGMRGVPPVSGTSGAGAKAKVYSQAEVNALKAELVTESLAWIRQYEAAKTPEEKNALIASSTVQDTIDNFVIDFVNKRIELPPGVHAISVVAPAIKEFLTAKIGYSIELPVMFGSHDFSFSLKPFSGGQQDPSGLFWSESVGR
jgi:hypothetical protein